MVFLKKDIEENESPYGKDKPYLTLKCKMKIYKISRRIYEREFV